MEQLAYMYPNCEYLRFPHVPWISILDATEVLRCPSTGYTRLLIKYVKHINRATGKSLNCMTYSLEYERIQVNDIERLR